MRPGLATIGGVLIVVGLLIVAISLLNLPDTTTWSQDSGGIAYDLPADGAEVIPVLAPYGHTEGASLSVSWIAGSAVDAYALICQPTAPQLPPERCQVPGAVCPSTQPCGPGGNIQVDPADHFPYYVYFVNPGANATQVDVSIDASSTISTGLSLWEVSTIVFAGIVLAAMGGIASFLGYFLKGNPYAPKPPSAGGASPPDEEKTFW